MSGSLGYRWTPRRAAIAWRWGLSYGVGKMPKILIIDDEPDLRLALAATLEDHGYDVVEGTDGSEALELAVMHAPDVVLMDVNMPLVDGMTALRILKGDSRTAGIPVCLVTAVRDVSYQHYAIEMGASDFFVKPWNEARMIRRLAELITPCADGSGGSTLADAYVEFEPSSEQSQILMMDRCERLTESIQARHNTWGVINT
jgi:CheY-like chemotaxis protein